MIHVVEPQPANSFMHQCLGAYDTLSDADLQVHEQAILQIRHNRQLERGREQRLVAQREAQRYQEQTGFRPENLVRIVFLDDMVLRGDNDGRRNGANFALSVAKGSNLTGHIKEITPNELRIRLRENGDGFDYVSLTVEQRRRIQMEVLE